MEIILTTFGKKRDAEKVCRRLLGERLIACAIFLKATSLFRWKGKIALGGEVLAIIKTPRHLAARARKRLRKLHPYELPEIVTIKAKASKEYLDWLSSETKPIFR